MDSACDCAGVTLSSRLRTAPAGRGSTPGGVTGMCGSGSCGPEAGVLGTPPSSCDCPLHWQKPPSGCSLTSYQVGPERIRGQERGCSYVSIAPTSLSFQTFCSAWSSGREVGWCHFLMWREVKSIQVQVTLPSLYGSSESAPCSQGARGAETAGGLLGGLQLGSLFWALTSTNSTIKSGSPCGFLELVL